MRSIRALLFVAVITVLLIACGVQPDPTPTALPQVVTSIAPTPTPTLVPLPDSAENTTPDPVTPPADLPTPINGTETLPTPEINADAGVTIVTPADGAEVLAGDNLTVSGAVQEGSRVRVVVRQQHASLLIEETVSASDGNWNITLTTPTDLVGPLLIEASAIDAESAVLATTSVAVFNAPDLAAEAYILINTPVADTQFNPGTQLSISGEAKFSAETASVTLSILYDECQTIASTISFDMVGSGVWEGFMALPAAVNGPFCVTATLDVAQSRTAYVPLLAEP